MRILNSKELAGLSQVYPEGFTGRVGLMILKAQHQQDLKDFIWWLEAKQKFYNYALINGGRKENSFTITITDKDIEYLRQLLEE